MNKNKFIKIIMLLFKLVLSWRHG